MKLPKTIPTLTATLAAALSIALSGCQHPNATQTPLPKAHSSTPTQLSSGFTWLDLQSSDPKQAADFYQKLFGWSIEPAEGHPYYQLLTHNGNAFAGLFESDDPRHSPATSLWLPTILVTDFDTALETARQNGKVLYGPINTPERGSYAVIEAPDASRLVLNSTPVGQMSDSDRSGNWFWNELLTQDPGAAERFYTNVLQGAFAPFADPDVEDYRVLTLSGSRQAGLVPLEDIDNIDSHWLPYFAVDKLEDSLAIAKANNGSLLYRNKTVAILADPTGAVFGIQERKQP